MNTNEIFRNFKGIWIPREIWLRSDLNYFEKILWAEIDSLDHPEKGCTASNKYFMEFFGIQERAVQIGLSKLKNLKLITFELRDGKKRVLRNALKYVEEKFDIQPQSTPQKNAPHPAKKCTPSQGDTLSIYNKVNISSSSPPQKPEKILDDSALTKEEEEEIQKRLKERPTKYPEIKNRAAWERSVLEEIRKSATSDKAFDKLEKKHKEEARTRDLTKIGEWTVWASQDQVEFTSGSCFKAVKYRVSDEAWYDQVLWEK